MNGFTPTPPYQKVKLEKAALDYTPDEPAAEMSAAYWQLLKLAKDNNMPLELQASIEATAIEWDTIAHEPTGDDPVVVNEEEALPYY